MEKKGIIGWWLFILVLLIITGVVVTTLSYAGVFTDTIVERKVLENSYQYSEARKTEILTYEAQIAEIESKLTSLKLDEETKKRLETQLSALRVKLNVARRR